MNNAQNDILPSLVWHEVALLSSEQSLLRLRLTCRAVSTHVTRAIPSVVIDAAKTHFRTQRCRLFPLVFVETPSASDFPAACRLFVDRCRAAGVDLIGYGDMLFKQAALIHSPRISLAKTGLFLSLAGLQMYSNLWNFISNRDSRDRDPPRGSRRREYRRVYDSSLISTINYFASLHSEPYIASDRRNDSSPHGRPDSPDSASSRDELIPIIHDESDWNAFVDSYPHPLDAVALSLIAPANNAETSTLLLSSASLPWVAKLWIVDMCGETGIQHDECHSLAVLALEHRPWVTNRVIRAVAPSHDEMSLVSGWTRAIASSVGNSVELTIRCLMQHLWQGLGDGREVGGRSYTFRGICDALEAFQLQMCCRGYGADVIRGHLREAFHAVQNLQYYVDRTWESIGLEALGVEKTQGTPSRMWGLGADGAVKSEVAAREEVQMNNPQNDILPSLVWHEVALLSSEQSLLRLRLTCRAVSTHVTRAIPSVVIDAAKTHFRTQRCRLFPLVFVETPSASDFPAACRLFVDRCRAAGVDLIGYGDMLFKEAAVIRSPRISLAKTGLFLSLAGLQKYSNLWNFISKRRNKDNRRMPYNHPDLTDPWGEGDSSLISAINFFESFRSQPYIAFVPLNDLALDQSPDSPNSPEELIPTMNNESDWNSFVQYYQHPLDAIPLILLANPSTEISTRLLSSPALPWVAKLWIVDMYGGTGLQPDECHALAVLAMEHRPWVANPVIRSIALAKDELSLVSAWTQSITKLAGSSIDLTIRCFMQHLWQGLARGPYYGETRDHYYGHRGVCDALEAFQLHMRCRGYDADVVRGQLRNAFVAIPAFRTYENGWQAWEKVGVEALGLENGKDSPTRRADRSPSPYTTVSPVTPRSP
ncbi:hypothetical protein HDU93_005552 [Gonapodya sp. JEL0774]|nr:hypothetical protein HDU93_005552 [Gonapodya sp. JEL0774]